MADAAKQELRKQLSELMKESEWQKQHAQVLKMLGADAAVLTPVLLHCQHTQLLRVSCSKTELMCVLCCTQAWQFRQLESLTRLLRHVAAVEARLEPSSHLSTALATAQLCTDKLEGLTVGLGLDEGMAMLASIVASCSKLTTTTDAICSQGAGRQLAPGKPASLPC